MDVTDDSFEQEVLEKSKQKPVLVDFWATWCAPCMMFKPVLEAVAEKDDRFVLAKLNTDENPSTSDGYGINAIPAVKLFKDGEVKAEFVGMKPEDELKSWLDENL